jgi:uncharacterized membrane protein
MTVTRNKRVLEPIDRILEVLFGLIMVLTFTGTLSAAESGRGEVHAMLIGAIGCNLAWGLIDAIMYLMSSLAERTEMYRIAIAVRTTTEPAETRRMIADVLPPIVASTLVDGDYNRIRTAISGSLNLRSHPGLGREDLLGAFAVFLLVFISTFPVALPFIFLHDAVTAMRVSNAIAVAMLFGTGYAFGNLAGYRPWLVAMAMVALGIVLVALTIALGG